MNTSRKAILEKLFSDIKELKALYDEKKSNNIKLREKLRTMGFEYSNLYQEIRQEYEYFTS